MHPPPPPIPTATSASTPPTDPAGRWTVGALSYSTRGLVVLFLLLLIGDFAWAMKERNAPNLVQIMLRTFSASDFTVGLLIGSVPAGITMLVGPFVGVWSDRTRTRWGRRIPFLFVPMPCIVAAMVGLGYAPVIGAQLCAWSGRGAPETWIIGTFAACWTVFEVFTVISNSVFTGLINDVVPRQVIGRFFGLFRAVSLMAGMLFNYTLLGHAEAYFTHFFVAMAVLYAIGFMVMCRYVKEGPYPPPEPRPAGGDLGRSIGRYARQCCSHRYYVLLFAMMAITGIAFSPVNLFSIYAAKGFGLSVESFGHYIAATYACSLVLAYPLGWLTDRFHPLRTGGCTLALYAVVAFLAYTLVDDAASFGVALLVHGVLSGTFLTTTAGLGLMLFPRLHFTQFMSAAAVATNLGSLVLAPLLGRFLDANGHDYRATFLIGGLLATLGLLLWLMAYARFLLLGGTVDYHPPAVPGQHETAGA